jgi:acetyl-CoA carboxylase carboxyl transferase beta subunit
MSYDPTVTTRRTAQELIDLVVDDDSWESWDLPPQRGDISPEYAAELARAEEKTGLTESVVTGRGTLRGRPVVIIAGEFSFLAGSIGRDAAKRLVTAIERATEFRLPLLAAPCSGGTRMQEGTPAFVTMIKIAHAISLHRKAGLPNLVYLRHPTTGGVMATWGSLGQMSCAEPGALVGFLGPRVYEALYGEKFPEGVQTSENLYAHGIIDAVVEHEDLAEILDRSLNIMLAKPELPARPELPEVTEDQDAWDSIQRSRRADRPGVRDLLRHAASDVIPLHGTGQGESDPGLFLGLVRFGNSPAVLLGQDRRGQQGQPMGPEALRVAHRGMQLAEELGLPLMTVIDTPGAALSPDAEQGGLAGEIARSLANLSMLQAPSLCLLLGEGNGGGALALLPADTILAAQNAWLSPLPPEGASAIVFRNTDRAAEMARNQRVRSTDLRDAGVVDQIIPELPDAADEPEEFCRRVGSVLQYELAKLATSPLDELRARRSLRINNL